MTYLKLKEKVIAFLKETAPKIGVTLETKLQKIIDKEIEEIFNDDIKIVESTALGITDLLSHKLNNNMSHLKNTYSDIDFFDNMLLIHGILGDVQDTTITIIPTMLQEEIIIHTPSNSQHIPAMIKGNEIYCRVIIRLKRGIIELHAKEIAIVATTLTKKEPESTTEIPVS
jgi:hypothetical protein